MFGLIGALHATEGNRDSLVAILLEGTADMPGCSLYAIATDASDEITIWITEFWESEDMHRASLEIPNVRSAIERARPIIAGFGPRYTVNPSGIHGKVT